MHLYKTSKGNILKRGAKNFLLIDDWDKLINQLDLYTHLLQLSGTTDTISEKDAAGYINDFL